MPQPFQPTGFGPGPIIPNHGLPNMQAATPTANPFSSLPVPTIPNGAQLGRGGRGVGILPFHTGHPQPAGAAIANLIAPSQNTTDSEFEQLDAEGTILGSLADTNTPSEGDELLETGQHLAPMQFISQALGPGDPAHSNLLAIARERARRGHLPPIRSGQRLADLENGVGDLVYVPHLDRVDLESNVRQRYRRGRLKCTNVNLSTDNRRDDDGEASATSKMGADDWTDRRYSLLRTYEKDFELFSLPEDADGASDRANDVAVVCFGATRLPSLDNTALTRHFEATSRLSMLAHMPDLYCVVLGSPTGHVMLVSLTRMARPTYHLAQPLAFDRGMRVEYILPRRSEDAAHRPTEPRPLYGVAVGRVPTADDGRHGGHGSENALLPKRYRLMLHYQNHLILTYELTRDEQTQKLLIF